MCSERARASGSGERRRRAVRKLGAGTAVLLWFATLGAGCDSQATVVEQICCGLRICTGVEVPDCAARIEDGLLDHRLSRTGVARCADCMANNVELGASCKPLRAGCPTILDERDCDAACSELDVALNARTNALERKRACDTVVASCRSQSKLSDACGFDALLRADATRAVDAEIEACAACINETACPSAPTDAPRNACDDHTNRLDLPFCGALIDRCSTACSRLGRVASELKRAGAALSVCRRGVEACVRDERKLANAESADALAQARRDNLELAPFLGELVTTERSGFGGAGGESGRIEKAAFMQLGGAGGNDDGGGSGGLGDDGGGGGLGGGGQGGAGPDGPPAVPELKDCYVALRQLPLAETLADAERAGLIEGCSACLQAAPSCEDVYNCAECRALYPVNTETNTLGEP